MGNRIDTREENKATKEAFIFWYIGLAMLTIMIAFMSIKVEAKVITREKSLGGMSKLLNDWYDTHDGSLLEYFSELDEKERQRDILYRIVEAEATDGTIEQKMNVASCILARVSSRIFPNTIELVVFQEKQFTPIKDGRYYKVEITQSTRDAVDAVLKQGWTHSCLYFCTPSCQSAKSGFHKTLEFEFYDGMHNYYEKEF